MKSSSPWTVFVVPRSTDDGLLSLLEPVVGAVAREHGLDVSVTDTGGRLELPPDACPVGELLAGAPPCTAPLDLAAANRSPSIRVGIVDTIRL